MGHTQSEEKRQFTKCISYLWWRVVQARKVQASSQILFKKEICTKLLKVQNWNINLCVHVLLQKQAKNLTDNNGTRIYIAIGGSYPLEELHWWKFTVLNYVTGESFDPDLSCIIQRGQKWKGRHRCLEPVDWLCSITMTTLWVWQIGWLLLITSNSQRQWISSETWLTFCLYDGFATFRKLSGIYDLPYLPRPHHVDMDFQSRKLAQPTSTKVTNATRAQMKRLIPSRIKN